MTTADLSSYEVEWVDPVSINYRGYDVWELPPNGQGIAALQILNILEGYDFSKIAFGSDEHIHLFTEAKNLLLKTVPNSTQIRPFQMFLSKYY